MSRASKFVEVDANEAAIARSYLIGPLGKWSRSEIKAHDNGVWLTSDRGTTYAVLVVLAPNPQTGLSRLLFTPAADPIFSLKNADWLVIFEPFADRFHMIEYPALRQWLSMCQSNPQACDGKMSVRREPDGITVMMHLDWAASQQILQTHTLDKGAGGGEFFKYRAEKLREPERFVHLHNHSSYSLLDGVSSIEGIAQCAYLNGQPGIALTDHGNCFGAFRHWKACKDRGIKALMGCEIYFVENVNERYTDDDGVVRRFEHHLTLIAQDAAGWANLSKMLTVAARDHYYYVPRVDWQLLQTYSEGIICLTGCVKGPVAHFLQTRLSKEGESKLPWWNQRNLDRVVANLARLQSIFGDRLYGECMNIDYSPYAKIVPELIEFLDHFDIPRVLTNDNHYETANDAELQAMLTRISNQKVDELGGRFQKQGLYYIRDANELTYPSAPPQSWLTPDMLERTVEVMDRCSLSFDRKGYLFPPFAVEEDPMWAQFLAVRGGQGDKVTGGHGEE